MWLTKRYFPSPHWSFYCSFTPALFCDCKKAQNKFGFTFGRCFRFEICKPCVCHREQDITTVGWGGGAGGDRGGKNTDRHAAGGGGGRGWCIFSENTARTSSRRRRPREEWKNNILPFRPEFSVRRSPLLLFFILSFFSPFHFVITRFDITGRNSRRVEGRNYAENQCRWFLESLDEPRVSLEWNVIILVPRILRCRKLGARF